MIFFFQSIHILDFKSQLFIYAVKRKKRKKRKKKRQTSCLKLRDGELNSSTTSISSPTFLLKKNQSIKKHKNDLHYHILHPSF